MDGVDDYRVLFEESARPSYVADRETLRFLAVNRAVCELYGWSRDEMLAMTLKDIRPPEDVPLFEAVYADPTKAGLTRYSRASRHRTKHGQLLDVRLEITRITFAGRPAFHILITDVTGIDEAERRFRLLVENSADGISLMSAEHEVEYISPGGLRILGRDKDEQVLRGKSTAIVMHPEDRARWVAPAPGHTTHHLARARHRDGSWRWIESVTTNLTHDPAVRAYVSNYRDITERVVADHALRVSERNFRTLIEHAPIATFVHRDMHYVYLNPAAVAMLGFSDAAEIVGQHVLDTVHPDDRDVLRRKIERLDDSGPAAFSTVRIMRADGSTVVLEGEAMLLDFDGMTCHVVMCRDVTERDAVFARIAMADRMLSIGTLAAGVAHEINNPLAYIATNLELLSAELPNLRPNARSRLTDATLHCLVSDAREGVGRVNAIVRGMRSLSRPEDSKPGSVDVVEVLASSIKMTHNETRHRARVVQDHERGLPLVEGDGTRLGQVFVNLLINGAQAIVEGKADANEIRVRTSTTPDRSHVRIDISDTGAGIAPAIIGRIFDPFFTTKAPGSGTGLGLAISHQIVHSMGGEIRVDSKAGAGSTFTVILPVARVDTPRERPEKPTPTRFTQRILLVDDEAAVGRSLQMLLAPETEVVFVVRAEDALARLVRGEAFDAILCDVMMPHSTGIQLYEEIARVAPAYLGRIIFMTGGAFTPHARTFLASLDRPHLEKPFSEQELREAIATVTAP